jgi:hypothetical protein
VFDLNLDVNGIVKGGTGSSLQFGGVWLPKYTFVRLVEMLYEDKDNENDTGRSYV